MANPSGRPSLYKPEYCELLVEHMAQGFSFESFAAIVDTHRDTLYEWCKVHESFSDAKKRGRDKSLIWWEKVGMIGMGIPSKNGPQLKNFSSAMWIFTMKNRHGYSDKVENVGEAPKNYVPPESMNETPETNSGSE